MPLKIQPNRRRDPRLTLQPMYTSVRARPRGRSRRAFQGHVYDISRSGARIELDQPLKVGSTVHLTMRLPAAGGAINAAARIVWRHDEHDDPGPRRMAVCFTEFKSKADRARLLEVLSAAEFKAAA